MFAPVIALTIMVCLLFKSNQERKRIQDLSLLSTSRIQVTTCIYLISTTHNLCKNVFQHLNLLQLTQTQQLLEKIKKDPLFQASVSWLSISLWQLLTETKLLFLQAFNLETMLTYLNNFTLWLSSSWASFYSSWFYCVTWCGSEVDALRPKSGQLNIKMKSSAMRCIRKLKKYTTRRQMHLTLMVLSW